MLEEINAALKKYNDSWAKLLEARADKAFFTGLKPVSVGWKVDSDEAYATAYRGLRQACDRTVETWMNGRWIAKMHLKDQTLEGGVRLIKLMQRRPGSSDALGLDHVDFYSPAVADAETILQQEPGLKWSKESNDVVQGYEWISLWFDGTEAKLKASTVIDIIIQELSEINDAIKA